VSLFYALAFPSHMARFAKRVTSIEPSPTVRLGNLVSEMKARGEKVLSLSVGEPDFPTPKHIVDAAKEALDEDFTKYTPSMGIPELRQAIAEKSRKEDMIPATAENVLVAPTKHALFMACVALLERGDEAILPDPGWVSYAPMVRLAGAKPVPVRAAEEEGFVLTPEAVAEAITPKTRMMILNSPSNPAGSVASWDATRGLAELAEDHDLIVASDEIYEKILYEGEHTSPASLDGMFDRTVTVNGFSKTYAMTGWRLGWLVAPTPIVKEIAKVQEHSITCATSFAQKAGVAALRGPKEPLEMMLREFRARRDLILSELEKIDRVTCFKPAGAFYVFPRFDVPLDSAALSERLLKEARVAVTPGSAFGRAGEGHQRLSYAASRETIAEGVRRIAETVGKL